MKNITQSLFLQLIIDNYECKYFYLPDILSITVNNQLEIKQSRKCAINLMGGVKITAINS